MLTENRDLNGVFLAVILTAVQLTPEGVDEGEVSLGPIVLMMKSFKFDFDHFHSFARDRVLHPCLAPSLS